MPARLYAPSDYATVAAWWQGHNQPAVPQGVLPPCGFVMEEPGGRLLCAAWLYQAEGVSVAWLAWLVSNPAMTPIEAENALDGLVCASQVLARDMGATVLFTMTERHGLGALLQRRGFVPNHRGMTQFFRTL